MYLKSASWAATFIHAKLRNEPFYMMNTFTMGSEITGYSDADTFVPVVK